MKIEVDTHTHSVASLHAYSTLDELARGARRNRLKGFVLSEHGPALQGGFPHPYYFGNMHILPRILHGVRLFHGVELNVMDEIGGIDLPPKYTRHLDLVLCGLHESCFPPQDSATNTRALIAIIENPMVDGITHPGNPAFPVDFVEVVKAAVRHGKFLEINNGSFRVRSGSAPNCRRLATLAKEYGAFISIASDAHYWTDVGNLTVAKALVDEIDIHRDQVINHSYKKFITYIEGRKAARLALG
jgi:putative hydrolase